MSERRSASVVWRAGMILGLLLGLCLALLLRSDRLTRMGAAERQAKALASGGERLLVSEIRNLERAMTGVAFDVSNLERTAPAQAPTLSAAAIAGVLQRQPEMVTLTIVDTDGRSLMAGTAGDQALPTWIAAAGYDDRTHLRMGPVAEAGGIWTLPLAVPLDQRRWVLARVKAAQMQHIVDELDAGTNGVAAVSDQYGTILARSRQAKTLVGTPVSRLFAPYVGHHGERISAIDGTRRITADSLLGAYPVRVGVGIAVSELLKPWYVLMGLSVAIYALYWLAFAYLYQRIRAADVSRASYLKTLTTSARRLTQAQQAGKTGTWSVERASRRLEWSPTVAQIFGLDPGLVSTTTDFFYAMVHPDDLHDVDLSVRNAWIHGTPIDLQYRLIRPDGDVRVIATKGARITDRDESTLAGTIVDITERVLGEANLADAERRLRLMFDKNPLPFWVFDIETLAFVEVNEAAQRAYGYTRDEFLAMTILDIRPEGYEARVTDSIGDTDGFDETSVWVHRRRDGSTFEVRVHASDIEMGGRHGRLVLAEDVSERMAIQRNLAYRATHDPLTDLLNIEALVEALDDRATSGGWYDLAYVQLRGLDVIADTFGLAVGREVIKVVATRFAKLGAGFGLAAHRPGETFVLTMLEHSRHEEALAALMAAATEPVPWHSAIHSLDARVGLASFPAEGATAEKVIGHAALAAQRAGVAEGTVRRFEPAMAKSSRQRLQLTARMRGAIENEELLLHFQPVMNVADGQVAMLEALVRWPQSDGLFMPPSEFIPLCEETGLILPLGAWVLRQAAAAHQHLTVAGWGQLGIAVNVSAIEFARVDVAQEIDRVIKAYGLPRGALHVELTESSFMHQPERALRAMRDLQALGVPVALDDFGTGFSSLAYLRSLPINSLKIDRVFVTEVTTNARSASICLALIALSHSLDLTVVAEGVETAEQLAWLKAHHCDFVQGYLVSPPLPLDAVVKQLQASKPGSAIP
ncbi:bifunctional diguanylate cyclase/phosphodiesterase [Pinirhizobacter sp.]|uniref:bifunctional diguanylate cyclase/phosphodiesterase n=1 Tax=Pinirhizobacter sp. TaxID=2950432 RepID=UPI002F42417E